MTPASFDNTQSRRTLTSLNPQTTYPNPKWSFSPFKIKYVCVDICICVGYVDVECRCPQSPDVRHPPRDGVTDGWELPSVGWEPNLGSLQEHLLPLPSKCWDGRFVPPCPSPSNFYRLSVVAYSYAQRFTFPFIAMSVKPNVANMCIADDL